MLRFTFAAVDHIFIHGGGLLFYFDMQYYYNCWNLWGAIWKNIVYCCDRVFVAYLCNFLSNLYIGYISFIISDKMFYKHDKKRLQNKFEVSNLLYLIYQLYYIGQNASQRCQKMTEK